ncbi:Outer membrane protein beta-barrel domain-containing protein [Hymenobacter gelipurpurascens]|uniref:Outer membrane protein beta-barrel domain-containing protein n=1 Tax=Hymenobacter gelipurpurascens TaxID=89968 RepID=A0A212TJV0_9BACT|nr:outer membrane beta-barrel protein [Hymenobacter gelipurpurascens]SNC66124.1 Outer membrane protein beta-barrel domain-containing protein [Hymenobacter gelipurpurascens]
MTENDSEKFYADLREKLADYGSAPPELVWEGIRQQVPAQPKRRWGRVAILLLLLITSLVVFTTSTRYWRQATGLGQSAAGKASVPSPSSRIASSASRAAQSGNAAAGTTPTPEGLAAEQSGLAGSLAETNPTATTAELPLAEAKRTPRTSLLTKGIVARDKEEKGLLRQQSVGTSDDRSRSTAKRKRRGILLAALLPSRRSTSSSMSGLRERRGTQRTGLRNETSKLNRSRLDRLRNRPAARHLSSEQPDATSSATRFASVTEAFANQQAEQRFSNELLALLPVQLQLDEPEEPEVRRVKRQKARRSRAAQLLRGWSVQVLAGSSLTYRTLGDSARQVEHLERPGIGYSGQLMASYALNKRLTVSTGLGYAEYANNLKFQVKKASQETAHTVDFRDVYRFVTVPLLAQYTLGGNQRWQFGTQGGGTLGLLAGTRTTQGSACNCSQATSPPEGTYRNTSLLLTAGGFLSYQFAPGQWLTLRPQGSYFLNSLTDPTTGKATRHPWSVGVQGGISFDLEPKK